MSSPKGYPTQEKDARLKSQYCTVEPVSEKQYALSVAASLFAFQVGTDAVEASSTTSQVNATGHVAKVGDIVRFTSGALSGKEVKVSSISTNYFMLAETMVSAPAAAVTFEILRNKTPVIASDGSIPVTAVQAAIKFTKDGSDVTVNEDTVTPANNRPLPVKLTGVTGDLTITAQNLNVQSTHTGANPDSMQLGDGTTLLGITVSNEAKVADATARTSLGNIDTKLPATLGQKAMAASLAVVVASDQSAIPASQSGTWNITNLSGTVSLPTGASTLTEQQSQTTHLSNISGKLPATLGQKAMAASMAVVVASDQSAIPSSQSGTWNIADVTGTISLPTGAATGAKQDTGNTSLGNIDTKLPATLGQKAMAASLAVVIASDQSAVAISAAALPLPSGASTLAEQQTQSTTLSAISGKLPATLGQKTMAASLAVVIASDQAAFPVTAAALDVVDFIDTNNLLDTSSTNIPGSGGSPVTIVASLAAAVKKIQVLDTTGSFFGVYTGAAASEVLQAVVGPGSDSTIEVAMAAAERVSLKRLDSVTAVSTGIVAINFYG